MAVQRVMARWQNQSLMLRGYCKPKAAREDGADPYPGGGLAEPLALTSLLRQTYPFPPGTKEAEYQ